MKNIIKLFTCTLILPVVFMPIKLIARSSNHIGIIQSNAVVSDSDYNSCAYWVFGDIKKARIFYENPTMKFALINIDGQDIIFNQSSKRYRNYKKSYLPENVDYKSGLYQAKMRNVKDISTLKDKERMARRFKSSLEIISTSGWKKNLQIECVLTNNNERYKSEDSI